MTESATITDVIDLRLSDKEQQQRLLTANRKEQTKKNLNGVYSEAFKIHKDMYHVWSTNYTSFKQKKT